jgi:putative membrane protein
VITIEQQIREKIIMTDKFIFRFIAAITVFVLAVVIILNLKVIPVPAVLPSFTHYLPILNACLNGTCSVLLLISLYFIMNGKVTVHKRINILAFILSSLFLVSYILLHWLLPRETIFGDINGDGVLSASERINAGHTRTVYLVILISHIILAAAVLPLILLSFYYGLKMQVQKHKKLVRWAFPIWLYVTVTGVIVYLMVSPYYHF